MEKAEAGQFLVLSFLLQESQTTLKALMEETGFSKATVTKYILFTNERAQTVGLDVQIHLQEEQVNLSIGCSYQGERLFGSLFLENAVKYLEFWSIFFYHQQFLAPSAGSRIDD